MLLRSLLAALAALAVCAPAAWGHAAFLGSTPAPGARVEASPSQVTLRFTETLERKLSRAELTNARTGRRIGARTEFRTDRTLVLLPNGPLPRAPYRVRWHTLAEGDAHELEGTFSFGVRTAAAAAGQSTEQSPLARGGWIRAVGRALLYLTLLLFAGGLILQALRPRWIAPGGPGGDAVAARERSLVADLGIAAAGSASLVAAFEATRAAGTPSVAALQDFLFGSFAGLTRVGIVALVLLALGLMNRRPRIAAISAVYALGMVALSGHANSADPRPLALLSDWVHLVAGAIWLGGVTLLLLAWGPEVKRAGAASRRVLTRTVLPAFGRVALWAFVVLVVSGSVNALVELGSPAELWQSAYGRIVLAKIVLAAIIALAAWGNSRRLRWGLLRAEPVLGVAVVALAGLLVAFPLPPRQADATASAGSAGPVCDPCPLPAPTAAELPVAGQGGTEVVAGWIRRAPQGLAGTVRALDRRGDPSGLTIRVPGARQRPCGAACVAFSGAPARPTLSVTLTGPGRRYAANLPAAWETGRDAEARSLLARAERTMRTLAGVRDSERVTSGPGTFARTDYRLRAPDRLAYRTDRGIEKIVIGGLEWSRSPGRPWVRRPYAGGAPFRTRGWFRWTPYAQAVRLLSSNDRTAEIAFFDPGTPVWSRLVIARSTGHVLSERLTARARFVQHVFSQYDRPQAVVPPKEFVRGG